MLPFFAALLVAPASILIQGGTIVDGSGKPGFVGDLRIEGERIAAVGRLKPRPSEPVMDARGLVVAPGFLDAHSHADGGAIEHPDATSQVRQGITTAIVGQDGGWSGPVAEHLARLRAASPALRFAAFTGHGGLRSRVMGEDYKRKATLAEIAKMKALLEADMRAGSLGLSSGLEYDPGYYGDTDELVALAKVAAKYGGRYISHVRDEGNRALESFRELIEIARRAKLPAQISHIKLATFPVWGKAHEVLAMIERARRDGLDITADVYPYLYWQSTITALSTSREWEAPETWRRALAEVGGPDNVLLSSYTHEPGWVGKTVGAIARETGREPVELVREIVRKTRGPGGSGTESVVVTAMREDDLEAFLRHPMVMFCSDGSIGGSHPRGAGSFPRILGRYVRERRVLSLEEAIRKMTSFPARRFGLRDRGLLKAGLLADVVLFDPAVVGDRATPGDPRALSVGIARVFVGGREVSLAPPPATPAPREPQMGHLCSR
ncbi:MAG: D-aminoacylase [Fimbriimonadaceae bacterium]|nr:D-aminoacylase [Fimbriimonadaceae bacterium]